MAESQPNGRGPWWRRHWLVLVLSGLGLIGLMAYAVLAARVLPAWIVSMDATKVDENHRLEAIVNTRGALLGVLAPVVVAIGAVAAFLNYRETSAQNRRTVELSRETLDVTRRGQLTERFTKAIDQLGQTAEDKLDIRLGGIYALEQIAKESVELHRPVMEILTAFLREHTRKPQETSAMLAEKDVRPTTEADPAATEGAAPRLRADFQAIATVLGRRQVLHDLTDFILDLRGAELQEANFRGAQLQKARFDNVQLQGANFSDAQLQGATFMGAQLQGANFPRAQLQEVNFAVAQLQGANFIDAQLQGATFFGAKLQKANFRGAQLQEAGFQGAQLQEAIFYEADLKRACFRDRALDGFDALGLTWEQLKEARNVDDAVLPSYLTEGISA
jgi:uncharacterized protein YjbI with pentapeptide repeats